MAATGAAFLGKRQRQIERIGNEIGGQRPAADLLAGREIVGLAVEAPLEVTAVAEDEVDVLVEIDRDRRVGHRDVARRRLARAVEMLMPAVERDAEDRPRFPFEGHAGAGVVPDRGRAAPVEDEHHLLEQLALWIEFPSRRDLADVAVVRGARGIVVEVDAVAATARPGLERDGAQVAHVVGADEVEAFAAHEAQVGRVLLGLELLRQVVGHHHIRALVRAIAHFACSMMARRPSTTSAGMFRSSATICKRASGASGSTSSPRRPDSAMNSGSATMRANAARSVAARSGASPGGARNERPISEALAASRMMFLPRSSAASSTTVGASGALALRARPMVKNSRASFLSSQLLPLTYSNEAEPEPWISPRSIASPMSAADLYPFTIANFVPASWLSAAGSMAPGPDGPTAPRTSSRLRAASIVCTGAVCQTTP